MMKTDMRRERERRVRYQIRVKPGITRLIAEFDESQSDALQQFIDILLGTGQWQSVGDSLQTSTQSDSQGIAGAEALRTCGNIK